MLLFFLDCMTFLRYTSCMLARRMLCLMMLSFRLVVMLRTVMIMSSVLSYRRLMMFNCLMSMSFLLINSD